MSTKKKYLVCGGAGYIGSHLVALLNDAGHETIVLDNLVTGHAECVKAHQLEKGDLTDFDAVKNLFLRHEFAAVFHFAALSIVSESMQEPERYLHNNVEGTRNLVEAMRVTGTCRKIIFSSTASVYGDPEENPISENHPLKPISVYGTSKLKAEQVLSEYARQHAINVIALRYFNAAGGWPEKGLCERHEPETHLIPNILKVARVELANSSANAHGKRGVSGVFQLYGDDFPTPDGSAIRDYIHVRDLCAAHVAAGDYLAANSGYHVFNLGTGRGYSVKEVLAATERVVGFKIPVIRASRRQGDPAILVADAARARKILGWQPQYDLVDMIASAWECAKHP